VNVRLNLRLMLGVVVAVLLVVLAVRVLPFISLAELETNQRELSTYGVAHPFGMAAIFVALYVGFAALPLPGAEVLTIAAGALFGLVEGTALVSFASSIGATLAFLMSRLWLRKMVQRRFSERADKLSRGIEEEGAFYLFALRLIPIVPFFLINLLMGRTRFASRDVLLGQPDRHAASDRCVCECRPAAWPCSVVVRNREPTGAALICRSWDVTWERAIW